MSILLHIEQTERQFWQRTAQGWQPLPTDYRPTKPVFVVADLAEETLAETDMPRVFGRDRAALLNRKLAARFPTTPYRAALKLATEGGFFERLAPKKHVLIGIEAAERINHALSDIPELVGICPSSLLLTHLASQVSLPADLFVIFPRQDGLRIVFLKNRIPVLTRLAAVSNQVSAHIEEINRTLRYLENSRLLERSRAAPPLLLLADAQTYARALAAAGLQTLPLPAPWNQSAPVDWRFPLFDLALKMPYAQLAPFERRTQYLASRLSQLAKNAAGIGLALAILASAHDLLKISEIWSEQSLAEQKTPHLTTELQHIEQQISAFAVPVETVRRAIDLQEHELRNSPKLFSQLQNIAQNLVLGEEEQSPRVHIFEWRLLNPHELACTRDANPASAPVTETRTPEIENSPSSNTRTEVNLELLWPSTSESTVRTRQLQDISSRLKQFPNLELQQDPVLEQVKGNLRGGTSPQTETYKYRWCFSLTEKTQTQEAQETLSDTQAQATSALNTPVSKATKGQK